MEDQLTPEQQHSQDILAAVVQQRDTALNGVAQLQAQIADLTRQAQNTVVKVPEKLKKK